MFKTKLPVLANPFFKQKEFEEFVSQFKINEETKKPTHVVFNCPSDENNFTVNLCLAMTPSGVIAVNDKMPWGRIDSDLNYFTNWANNNDVLVFGRKTFERVLKMSFWKDKPCIVLSSTKTYPEYENVTVVKNMIDIWDVARELILNEENKNKLLLTRIKLSGNYPSKPTNALGICGGAELYHYFMPFASELDLTLMFFDGATSIENHDGVVCVKGIAQFHKSESLSHQLHIADYFSGRHDFNFSTSETVGEYHINTAGAVGVIKKPVKMQKAQLEIYQHPHTHISYRQRDNDVKSTKPIMDFYGLKNVTGIVVFEGMDYTGKTTLLKNTLLAAERFYTSDNETISKTIEQFIETENYPNLVRVLRMLPYPTKKHKFHFMSISFPERTPEMFELMENKDGRNSVEVYRDIVTKHLDYFYRKVEEFKQVNNVGEDDEIIIFTDRSHISSAVYQNMLIEDDDSPYTATRKTLVNWDENAIYAQISDNNFPPISGVVYCYANLETRLERAQVRDKDSNGFISTSDRRTLKHHTLYDMMYAHALNANIYDLRKLPNMKDVDNHYLRYRTFALGNEVSPVADTSLSLPLELI